MRSIDGVRCGVAIALALACANVTGSCAAQGSAKDTSFKVAEQEVDDLKPVFATVRSKDLIEARVRTPGTIASWAQLEEKHPTLFEGMFQFWCEKAM